MKERECVREVRVTGEEGREVQVGLWVRGARRGKTANRRQHAMHMSLLL